MVERHLAKVNVARSNRVTRLLKNKGLKFSNLINIYQVFEGLIAIIYSYQVKLDSYAPFYLIADHLQS